MKLENKVCGAEISTVLYDLGLRLKSYFCWRWTGETMNVEPYINDEYSKTRAYLVSELMNILPKKIGDYWMRVEPDDAGWNITYFDDNKQPYKANYLLISINDSSLAYCLAKCLTWLIRKKYVKVEDLNL